jgi:hypothetical protein
LARALIEKSLRTGDHETALARRGEVVAHIRDAFRAAKDGAKREPDFVDLWLRLSEGGFYRPSDGFRFEGQPYHFVAHHHGRRIWAARCAVCHTRFEFEAPGTIPPRLPPTTCGADRRVA